jgi:hypothetical protein
MQDAECEIQSGPFRSDPPGDGRRAPRASIAVSHCIFRSATTARGSVSPICHCVTALDGPRAPFNGPFEFKSSTECRSPKRKQVTWERCPRSVGRARARDVTEWTHPSGAAPIEVGRAGAGPVGLPWSQGSTCCILICLAWSHRTRSRYPPNAVPCRSGLAWAGGARSLLDSGADVSQWRVGQRGHVSSECRGIVGCVSRRSGREGAAVFCPQPAQPLPLADRPLSGLVRRDAMMSFRSGCMPSRSCVR